MRNLLQGLRRLFDDDLGFLLCSCAARFETFGERTFLHIKGFTFPVQRCTFASNLLTLTRGLATDRCSLALRFATCALSVSCGLATGLFCVSLGFLACFAADRFSLLLCTLELGLCSAAGLFGTVQ